jgi:hypothetical protein
MANPFMIFNTAALFVARVTAEAVCTFQHFGQFLILKNVQKN